jgi:hypothetical protein
MQKLTQKALETKIIRGELEVEYGPTLAGHYQVRDCRTDKCRTIRVIH